MNNIRNAYNKSLFSIGSNELLPSVSIDCVIIGFHESKMKILLSKLNIMEKWALPGGFIFIDENVDVSAHRILKGRTGLEKVYLTQFHLFGDSDRTNIEENKQILEDTQSNSSIQHWFAQRFVTVGYYALIDCTKADIQQKDDEELKWYDIDDVPELYSDHNKVIKKAISTIKMQLGYIPIGIELLPEEFTMSELRTIYETILERKLDRRNFQRKMMMSGLIIQQEEMRRKWGTKPASLFVFDKDKYLKAIEDDQSPLYF